MIEQAWWNWFLHACPLEYWWMEGLNLNIGEDRLDVFETEFLLVPIKQILIGGENSIWRAELVIYFILCIQRCERLGTRLAGSVIIELSRAMYQTFSFPLYNSGTIRFIGLKVNWNCNWSLYLSFEATISWFN